MNVPKIRFKGFEGEWQGTTLSKIATIQKGEQINKSCLADSGTYYVLNGGQTPSGYTESYNTPENTISISEGGNSCGYVAYNTSKFWSGGHNYTLRNVTTHNEYLYSFLKSKEDFIMSLRVGSGLPNIQKAALSEVAVFIPKEKEEQQQIAEYFKNLDSLIEATGKKVASLKQAKQACLQSMFPQPGETTPRIRFKGFEGDWEKVQIGEISTSSKGNGFSKADLRLEGTPIVLYGRMYTKYSFEMDNIDTFATPKDGAVYSKGNEVVIPASGETAEDIAIAAAIKQSGVILGGDLNILTFDDDYLPSFMALCISNSETHYELSKYAQGKSVVHLRNNDIAKGTVTCPSLAEQQQIASFFSNLDKQIALQEQQLEKLKQVKAACLDNMFV